MKLTDAQKRRAVQIYKRNHFLKMKCCKCKTDKNVRKDELASKWFCVKCLEKDLMRDKAALIEALREDT